MKLNPPLPPSAVTLATCTLAIAASTASWTGIADLSGCLETSDISRGEWHRLLTSTILHTDILHLCFNLYWLWTLGTYLEAQFGARWYISLLLCFGFVSSAWEWALFDGGIGLSGIGYGLFGFLWVLSKRDETYTNCISRDTIVGFMIWLLLCIAGSLSGEMQVANTAHVAGLAAGAALGWAWTDNLAPRRLLATVAVALVGSSIGIVMARSFVNWHEVNRAYECFVLGQEAYDEDRLDDAIWQLERSTRLTGHPVESWDYLGACHEARGATDSAVLCYERALKMAPENQYALERLAVLRPTNGRSSRKKKQ